jgi:hypothetical protein
MMVGVCRLVLTFRRKLMLMRDPWIGEDADELWHMLWRFNGHNHPVKIPETLDLELHAKN